MASVVMSPARPRSSMSAARTSGSSMIGAAAVSRHLNSPRQCHEFRRHFPRRGERLGASQVAPPATVLVASGKSTRICAPRLSSRRRAAIAIISATSAGSAAVVAAVASGIERRCGGGEFVAVAQRRRQPASGSAARAPASAAAAAESLRPDGAPARRRHLAFARALRRRPPQTTASSSELLARRLAPCRPVQAASPQAHRPGNVLRPAISTSTPPMW